MFLLTKSCRQWWKAATIFTLLLVFFHCSLSLATDMVSCLERTFQIEIKAVYLWFLYDNLGLQFLCDCQAPREVHLYPLMLHTECHRESLSPLEVHMILQEKMGPNCQHTNFQDYLLYNAQIFLALLLPIRQINVVLFKNGFN